MVDVSIIIPTFNRLWSLPQAVESCRDTVCKTEIIVVDDGSTDGTWAWLQQQTDIVALRQENWGKDWAVNAALKRASGEYVRFLDSDDWLLPNANCRQLELARKESADVVVAGTEVYDETSGALVSTPWICCDDFIAQQLGECPSSHYSAFIFRKSFIAEIPHRSEFGSLDDRMFVIEVAMARPRVSVFGSSVFVHRNHSKSRLQSLTGMSLVAKHVHHLTIYRKALAQLDALGELSARRKRAAARVLWPLAHWVAHSSIEEGCKIAKWVFELDPDFIPPEQGLLGSCYRQLHFRTTERLLGVRRTLMGPIRRILAP